MSRDFSWDKLTPKLRERIIQSDPEGFSAAGIRVAAREVRSAEPQPHEGRALDQGPQTRQSSRGRMARRGPLLRIALISCRRRLISDRGNLPSGFKELQDCIARYFDLDDEDGTIAWEYGQHETRGEQETLVRIEIL